MLTGSSVETTDRSAVDMEPGDYYLSLSGDGVVTSSDGSSIEYESVDVLLLTIKSDDGYSWSMPFDGSENGLDAASENIDALAFLDNGEMIISTVAEYSVAASGGTITGGGEDLLHFEPGSPAGATGKWSLFFDGSDVGVSNVDALSMPQDDKLLMSFDETQSVDSVVAEDHDVLLFSPKSLGETTSGSWRLGFDGSDVGLNKAGEGINGLAGEAYVSTHDDVRARKSTWSGEDIARFEPNRLGKNTRGKFGKDLPVDGSEVGIPHGSVIDAIGLIAQQHNPDEPSDEWDPVIPDPNPELSDPGNDGHEGQGPNGHGDAMEQVCLTDYTPDPFDGDVCRIDDPQSNPNHNSNGGAEDRGNEGGSFEIPYENGYVTGDDNRPGDNRAGQRGWKGATYDPKEKDVRDAFNNNNQTAVRVLEVRIGRNQIGITRINGQYVYTEKTKLIGDNNCWDFDNPKPIQGSDWTLIYHLSRRSNSFVFIKRIAYSAESIGKSFLDDVFKEMENGSKEVDVINLQGAALIMMIFVMNFEQAAMPQLGDPLREAGSSFQDAYKADNAADAMKHLAWGLFNVGMAGLEVLPLGGSGTVAKTTVKTGRELVQSLVQASKRQLRVLDNAADKLRTAAKNSDISANKAGLLRQRADAITDEANRLRQTINKIESANPDDLVQSADDFMEQALNEARKGGRLKQTYITGSKVAGPRPIRRGLDDDTIQQIDKACPGSTCAPKSVIRALKEVSQDTDPKMLLIYMQTSADEGTRLLRIRRTFKALLGHTEESDKFAEIITHLAGSTKKQKRMVHLDVVVTEDGISELHSILLLRQNKGKTKIYDPYDNTERWVKTENLRQAFEEAKDLTKNSSFSSKARGIMVVGYVSPNK